MEEIWKDIKGYEGYYQVSNLGRIKSKERVVCCNKGKTKIKAQIIKPTQNEQGYLRVALSKNNTRKHIRVNRLVAENFISNPTNQPQVNHKNGIKTDNRVENLEWVSISENLKHSYQVLKRKKSMLGLFGSNNPTSKGVLQIKDGAIIAKFGAAKEAERITGISQGNISRCARTGRGVAGGYKWEYIK